jgi:hypothetical protein
VIVSDGWPSSSNVTVASPNSTSTTVAVHFGFGHEPAGVVGVSDSTVKRNWPFLGVASGPLLPVVVVEKLCPGATLPAGFVHSTLAVPGAETTSSKVVPPRPATLPVHSTVVPSSVQTGVPTKWPLCAKATVANVSAATVAAEDVREIH